MTRINKRTNLLVQAAFTAGAEQQLAPIACVFMDDDNAVQIAFNGVMLDEHCDRIGMELHKLMEQIAQEIEERAR
jgi:hypothetical protein